MNNNKMGGFHLVDIELTKNGTLGLRTKRNKKITDQKGIAQLGKGAEGLAFIGCIDDKCEKMIVIKSASGGLKLEYRIMKIIYKLSPHIVTPYMFVKCRYELLYQEYANGGDFLGIIRKYHHMIKPIHIKTIVFQVLITLMNIQKEFPSFKHNDLHLGNILVDLAYKKSGTTQYDNFYVPNIGLRALINDYGFATMDSVPNPKVVTKQYAKNYGIAPDSHKMFDAHMFLNALYLDVKRYPEFSEVVKFLTSVIPAHYFGNETTHIINSRLRYDMSHSDFPTFLRLLYHPYFSEFKKERTNVVKPKAKVSDECGKKAQPVTGIGAQKLTTQEMIDLIKRRGHRVPTGKPSREELCAVIKEHSLVVTPKQKVAAAPSPVAAAPVTLEAAKIKNFIASQNVIVEKPAPVPFLSNQKLWQLYTKKLTEQIYDTIPKNGEYENRMNQARDKAMKVVKEMKAKGEAPPPYYKKIVATYK
jgi:hypothetical protein